MYMKRISIPILFVAVVITFYASSCYYDNEQYLYGVNQASCSDTAGTISYSQKVAPLLSHFCYSCHAGATPSGGVLMGTYTSDKVYAQNGKLYGSITHSSGYSPMPQGRPALSACQLRIIRKWIDDGIPNN
jgi:hypothetical protein